MPARGEKEEAKDAHGIRCVPLHRNKSLRGDRLAGGGKLPVSSLVELALLEAGYTVRLHGKKITKTETRKEMRK